MARHVTAEVPAQAGTGPAGIAQVGAAQVRLLGGFRLVVDGAEVPLPTGSQRLVALLALHGRHTRSRAAGTLWPTATETRALGCLRTAIWRCQQAAPGLIQTGSTTVQISPAVGVDSADLVARARAAIAGGPVDLSASEGDLLPDWDDDWLAEERERLSQLHLHMLEAQADRLAADGRFGLALDAAMRALRADPLRESAHRAVISIHLAEGNVAQADRALRRCAEVLRNELGVAPSAQTVRLLDGVRRDAMVTVG